MRSFTLNEELETAGSILDLAARLGRICTTHESELQLMLAADQLSELATAVTDVVADSTAAGWDEVVRKPQRLEATLGKLLAGLLETADPHYPLDCLAVLRGLCRGVLPVVFEAAEGQIILEEGMPVPFAQRPLVEKPYELTPPHTTINKTELLSGFGHRIFEYKAGENVRVVLDFSHRDRLDALTWEPGRGFPRIATIHPEGCGDLEVKAVAEAEFFDAAPRAWSAETVLRLLRAAAGAEIAVLPELSIPEATALERALAESPQDYPSLIVAGSAHRREETDGGAEIRANEAPIYLDGVRIGAHRKCHPFVTNELEGKKLSAPVTEALSSEQKTITVLAGDHARLAVLICADLIDDRIPQKLIAAGVSTLVVPSFTPKKGTFNGTIADLASRRQAVAVIANAPPQNAGSPFHLMAAAPRPDPAEQTTTFPRPGEEPSELAIFDPNKNFDEALLWVAEPPEGAD